MSARNVQVSVSNDRDDCIEMLGIEQYNLLIKGFKITLKNQRKIVKKTKGAKLSSWKLISKDLIFSNEKDYLSVHKEVFGQSSKPDLEYTKWNSLIKAATYELINKI